jgi:uncharacterized protein
MKFFQVEVVFANPQHQKIISIYVPSNSCVLTAIKLSGILLEFQNIDFNKNRVGIFGRLSNLDTKIKEGDRIEIYQSLLIDPKGIRVKRAKKQKIS